MKTTKWAFVVMTLCAAPAALADEDGETREDPWDYDKEREEKREEAEREDQESESERTFGNSGEFVISAERLFGLAATTSKITLSGTDSKDSVTRLNLLTNANQDPLGYSAPRLAFDYFVADAISIGLALGFSSTSDDVKNRYFAVTPRFGYAFMFSEMFGVWPRVGATYLDQKLEVPIHGGAFAGATMGVVAISAELPVVIVPIPNVAFSIGPTFDGGVFGKINPEGPQDQTDFAMDEFGASAALSAFF